jgi:hypothetical protein
MPDFDEFDAEFEIQLIDGFEDCLLGCIYQEDDTPVPCYSSAMVIAKLQSRGMTEDEAVAELNTLTAGVTMLWVHPLEIA